MQGREVAIGDGENAVISKFTISGSSGTLAGTTPLTGAVLVQQFSIEHNKVVVPDEGAGEVKLYRYPAGGSPMKTIAQALPLGSTISK